ncbi:MAG: pyridoxal phosphate-dependent aminotransferase [Acidimicrobiia bacterium]
MGRISRRVGSIKQSATMAISERAAQLKSQGRPVISFGAGEPDFPTPPHIVEAAIAAARDPRNHHYTPNMGLPELRRAVADSTHEQSPVMVGAEQVLITNGGKQAVYLGLAALLDPGDEVLIPAPYWVTYPEATALSGGVPIAVPADEAAGFKVTVEQLESVLSPRTKVLIFVSPSNPTGSVYSPDEVTAIGRWAGQRGVWVLTDEIYQQLVYSSVKAASIAAVPEMEDRWLVINGVSKTYAMTGWRVGWMVGPADVIKAAGSHQSHLTSNVNNVSQRAALAALTGPTAPIAEMRQAFDRRRRIMHGALGAMTGVTCVEPQGAFYCFPGFAAHLDKFGSSMEVASYLLEEADVAIVPGEAFGAGGYARLSYALGDDELGEGLDRMGKALEQALD